MGVAFRFGVGVASVVRWLKKPDPKLSRNKPATKIDMEALARDVRNNSDAYQYEQARRFGVSVQGINYALQRMSVRYKKDADAQHIFRTIIRMHAHNKQSDGSGFCVDVRLCAPIG